MYRILLDNLLLQSSHDYVLVGHTPNNGNLTKTNNVHENETFSATDKQQKPKRFAAWRCDERLLDGTSKKCEYSITIQSHLCNPISVQKLLPIILAMETKDSASTPSWFTPKRFFFTFFSPSQSQSSVIQARCKFLSKRNHTCINFHIL